MHPSLLLDIQYGLISMALILPRALVCLTILPGFGIRTLTGIAKNAVAVALSLPALIPTFWQVHQTPPDVMIICVLSFKEACIGLLLGTVMAMPIWVAQSVGSILDTQRLPIQVQANNASVDRDASALGAMLLQAVVLLMIQAGLLIAFVRILLESYGVWPPFAMAPPFGKGQFDVLVKQFSEFFWHIIVYGGPVLIPLLLVDFGVSMVGAFASNLQISSVSSPLKCIIGLFILLVYWPTFSHYVVGDFSHVLDFTASLLQAKGQVSR